MKDLDLFQAALGLNEQWIVTKSEFKPQEKRLDIFLDFIPGSEFACPECKVNAKVHDTIEKTWQHLNFFQHAAYLHARVPRIECQKDGVKLIDVPWARKHSGFTLLFEALIMAMTREMPVNAIAALVGITDKRIWRVIEHYVKKDLATQDLSEVTRIGVDETSSKRGHSYVTIFVDMDTNKAIFVTEGKDASTVKSFKDHLLSHKGDPVKIKEFSSDLSPAFISGVEQYFPKASITFDKFHVVKLLNKALDEIRREERKNEIGLKGSRYIWLKNPSNLTVKQQEKFESLSGLNLKIARAYRMKLVFQDIYSFDEFLGPQELKKWYGWAIRSQLTPIREFAKTLKKHWDGIVRWFTTKLTNGILEGLNSLIQAAKARARGYRSIKTFKLMVYLIAGKLGALPT